MQDHLLHNTKRPTEFTYPEEESIWFNNNPEKRQKLFAPTKREMFEIIKKGFAKELTEFQDFINGKLEMSPDLYYKWFHRSLYYIEFPELFEKDIEGLGNYQGDDLSSADQAWIKNTSKLIEKYHEVVKTHMEELYGKRHLQGNH